MTPSSFLRRHPILAGFGVLAALSLFAAYWPLSAIVTGVIVAGRATGADRFAYREARRGLFAVARRLGMHRAPSSPVQPPAPSPPVPQPPGATAPQPPAAPHPPGPPSRRAPQVAAAGGARRTRGVDRGL